MKKRTAGRYAPWFFTSTAGREPLSYRGWKRLWQIRGSLGWRSDLFERIANTEWDVLVILDACRYDTLDSVADSAVIRPARSPATATPQFLQLSRKEGIFEDVVYVSANRQTSIHPPAETFDHVDLSEEAWDAELATVPPREVFEVAEDYATDDRTVVVHLLQPHYPHVCDLGGSLQPVPQGLHPNYIDERAVHEFGTQAYLSNGRIPLAEARKSYECAVASVWEAVTEFVAEMLEAGRTVSVTADHGELFGEWGFVEHPTNVPISELITVPWVTVEPTEEATHDVEDRLAALGYVD